MGRKKISEKPKSLIEQLTEKQRLFVFAYLSNGFNATQAAIVAGYSPKTAYSIGWNLLKKVEIQAAIQEQMESYAMPAYEVMARLGNQARLDISPFIKFIPAFVKVKVREQEKIDDDESGDGVDILPDDSMPMVPMIDLESVKQAGMGWSIKSVKQTRNGTEIEFHDPFAALQLIGKHHKLFSERNENMNVDLSTLSDDQLARLERGESVVSVLRSV